MSSSYHVRTEELYRALETISGQIEEWQDQLTQVQQAVETTKMTMSVQGETGDSIRSYLTEVQVPVIKGIRQVLEEYVMRLAGYIIGYQGIDTQMDAAVMSVIPRRPVRETFEQSRELPESGRKCEFCDCRHQ